MLTKRDSVCTWTPGWLDTLRNRWIGPRYVEGQTAGRTERVGDGRRDGWVAGWADRGTVGSGCVDGR